MAFKNEYVPPLAQETSEFLMQARDVLRKGHSRYDRWTADRERDMVLVHKGSGHEIEDANDTLWGFIDRKGMYLFSTETLSSQRSTEERHLTYKLSHFVNGNDYSAPDRETISCIKDALQEYSRAYLFDLEHYKRCQLRLIDAAGREI